jgi:hypothetical protein
VVLSGLFQHQFRGLEAAVAARLRSVIGALWATCCLVRLRLALVEPIACSPPLAVFLTNYLRNPSAMTPWPAQSWLMPLVGRCRVCLRRGVMPNS